MHTGFESATFFVEEKKISKMSLLALSIFVALSLGACQTKPDSVPEPKPGVGAHFSEFPALHEVYKDYFLIGTTSWNNRMTGEKLDIILHHFNAFTPENALKPDHVQRVRDVWTWGEIDSQFAKVEGLDLIGHTLAWHSQSSPWLWDNPNYNRETAKANLDHHIETVLGRYGGKLLAMDVVNEAFADGGGSPPDWRDKLRKTEGWYLALGAEWVELAFLKAAEVADRNGWDVKLYYNDYNMDSMDKSRAVYNMARELNEKHAGRRPNGKQLIEGIGMQGHYNSGTDAANVERSIRLFSSLPGVSVSITELDINWSNSGTLTEVQSKLQAAKYAELFRLFKRYAAGPANDGNGRIERVTFWGTNDSDSWRSGGFPLLFDGELRAKRNFLAVLEPDNFSAWF